MFDGYVLTCLFLTLFNK